MRAKAGALVRTTIRYLFPAIFLLVSFSAHTKDDKDDIYDKILHEQMSSDRISVIRNVPFIGIKIEGKIVEGDYRKFLDVVRNAGSGVNKVYLMSPGGDAFEAMRIGRLIRNLRYSTNAPALEINGQRKCIPLPTISKNCTCDSSCFLVYIAGVNRYADMLGIHRIFVDHSALKNISGSNAALLSKVIREKVDSYLKEMGAPRIYTDKLFSIPSDKIEYIPQSDLDRYFLGDIEEFSEWIKAKCKKEIEYDNHMVAIFNKKKLGKATNEEIKHLEKNYQFYLKLAGCKIDARESLVREVWVKEMRRAIKEEYPDTKFEFFDNQ